MPISYCSTQLSIQHYKNNAKISGLILGVVLQKAGLLY